MSQSDLGPDRQEAGEAGVPEEPLPEATLRAIALVVEEAREAEPPAIDWDRVEARLMARIAGDESEAASERVAEGERDVGRVAERRIGRVAERRIGRVAERHIDRVARIDRGARIEQEPPEAPYIRWAGMLAAAASVVLLIGFAAMAPSGPTASVSHQGAEAPTEVAPEPDGTAAPRPGEPSAAKTYAVGGVEAGRAIEARRTPLRFVLPGLVDWTLAPESRVVVAALPGAGEEEPHVLRLERGRIDATVAPHEEALPGFEAFVVEAAGTRVAVRGTRFSVAIASDEVEVEVTRGEVAVGPTGADRSDDQLLVSPRRASFRAGRLVGPAEASSAEGEPPNPPGSAASSGASAEASPSETGSRGGGAPSDAPTSPRKKSLIHVQNQVIACLAADAPEGAGQDTKVTIRTQVTILAGQDGTISSVQFSPPLRPDLQQRCASQLFGQAIDARGKLRFPVQIGSD